jgi:hypothetical protein
LGEITRRARIWRISDPSAAARGDINGENIAYTQDGYDEGARLLTMTFLHELMHNCGNRGGRKHYLAEAVALYCTEQRNIISTALGANLSTGDLQILISYRRILHSFASGRLQLTAGADVNAMGISTAINQAMGVKPTQAADFGSGMVGMRGRLAHLWGGEGYGGLSGSVDTGFGAGYFRMRTTNPGEDPKRTRVAGSYVLQLGLGAEFYIPLGRSSGMVVPVSFDAAYRLVQPLNAKARQIHALLGTLSFHFK